MGLGAVSAAFGALAARYVSQHGGGAMPARFIALVGDAELDECNVWEGRLEEAVRELDNLLWIVDVNRQSLDRVVPDARPSCATGSAARAGVIELRWGGRLRARFGHRAATTARGSRAGRRGYRALLRCLRAPRARRAAAPEGDGTRRWIGCWPTCRRTWAPCGGTGVRPARPRRLRQAAAAAGPA
jgi:pyruvate dehydrogenase E1 component